jgi:hypothetical protein
MNARSIARFIILLNGVLNTLTGLVILAAPGWFYDTIADFPPFNRHFLGDVGAFTLAIGVGLLIAARDPQAHSALAGVGALASLIHAVNHLYDDLIVERGATMHWLSNTLPLLVLALMLAWAWWQVRKEHAPGAAAARPGAGPSTTSSTRIN